MGRHFIRALTSAVMLWAVAGTRTHAQVMTADVVGTVTDSSNASVPDAAVTIEDLATRVSRTMQTNASGIYSLDLLQPGSYVLTVGKTGFVTAKVSLLLEAGQRARADVQLQVGSSTQTVEVQALPSVLQTETSTLGDVVTQQSVENLPLNGRNYVTLVQTTPGANAGNPNGIQTGQRPDDRRQTNSVSANGQPEAFNGNLIDGIDNNELEQGLILLRPSIEAIAEVEVKTNNYSAAVGRSAGAIINVITKAGTNEFHGSLFEYFRNDVLNANDFFSNAAGLPRPKYRQNQYGGSVGGPIRKDKTFFFGAFEQYRIVKGSPTGLLTVPTLFEQQNPGNLSDIGGPVIPTSQLDPVALQYFKLYPAPNVPGAGATNNFAANPVYTQNGTSMDVRLDHHFTKEDSVFARYSYNPVTTLTPGAFPALAGIEGGGTSNFPGHANETGQGVQINYLHIFNPRLLMEVKAGFTRLNIQSLPLNQGTKAAEKFGMPNADVNQFNSGLPPVNINGYAPLGDNNFLPIIDVNNVFQGNGDVRYNRGKHDIEVGAGLIRRQMNYYQAPAGTGMFNFNGPVPNSLASFLMGTPTTISRQMPLYFNYMRTWEPDVYIQDDWRATRWLTLNLGLRWEYFGPITNPRYQRANFDLQRFQMRVASSRDPSAGVQPDYKDFGPRIGFAASLGHDTVIRGGYGISYYPPDDAGSATNLPNPPFYYLFACQPGSTTQGLICPAGIGTLSQGPPAPVQESIDPTALTGTINVLPFSNPASYIQQFNLTFQKAFDQNVISVSYIGELGRRQPRGLNIDVPPPSTNPNATLPYSAQLPNVSGICAVYPNGSSTYNAAQITFEHRYAKGLDVTASYTYSSNLNNFSDPSGGISAIGLVVNNPRYDRGPSDIAIRHTFNMTASYDLPFAKHATGMKGALLGGWRVSSIAFYNSGLPYTVLDGAFAAAPSNIPGFTTDRPNVVPGQSFTVAHPNLTQWFNINAFAAQPFGTAGNEGRDQLWGPPNREVDLSAAKTFPVWESVRLQFRAECYNISNTANFGNPNSTIVQFNSDGTPSNAGSFGQITSTRIGSIPRGFQFALRLTF
jgi:hypothetical protein